MNVNRMIRAAAAAGLLLAGAGLAAGQIECTVVSAGGQATADGSIFVAGQFATGLVSGSDDLDQGVVPCWAEAGVACGGDVDGDLDIDLNDLAALLAAFGTCDGDADFNPGADFDGDSCVGLTDLATLLAAFGTVCS